MREDKRPYWLKKYYLIFRHHYTEHFIRPAFDAMGQHHTFMKPWFTHINGPRIRVGESPTIISEKDQRVRIGVWGNTPEEGEIIIGDAVLISPGCRISAGHSITIGDSVMMANGVYITDSDWHGLYDRVTRPKDPTPVVINDNVWLGDHCMVLKGVTIGENSVVGAGSVVTKDVPANVVVAGNPATVVKQLDDDTTFVTRKDFFANPVAMTKEYDSIDRWVLSKNSFWQWLRAQIAPSNKD